MLNSLKYFLAAVLLMLLAILISQTMTPKASYASEEVSMETPKATKKKAKQAPKKEAKKPDSPAKEDSTATFKTPAEESTKKEESKPKEVKASTPPSPNPDNLTGKDFFQYLKNSYLSPILAELPEGRSREDVVVRYYTHNMDNKKVYALRSLGYYLHEREPEDNKDLESNVLYYGKNVDLRDIQLVAYTLIENGVPLRSIEASRFEWKSSALEIGTDSLLQDRPLLTIGSVESFRR